MSKTIKDYECGIGSCKYNILGPYLNAKPGRDGSPERPCWRSRFADHIREFHPKEWGDITRGLDLGPYVNISEIELE